MTSYRVHLAWNGTDADGHVAGFYIAWDDTVAEDGSSAWTFTTAGESTFVVSADSCLVPPCDGVGTPESQRTFFRYHTFWVKAVDDEGAHDPTPAYRTMTATTVAPRTRIIVGPLTVSGVCDVSSEVVYVSWESEDPDGRVVGYWYRWDVDFDENPARCGPDPASCGWTFLPAESTRVIAYRPPRTPDCNPCNSIAIYAVDDAGAIEQIWQPGINWVCFFPDPSFNPHHICVDGGPLGTSSVPGCEWCNVETGECLDLAISLDSRHTVFVETPVGFRWKRMPWRGPGYPGVPTAGWRYAIDDTTGFSPRRLDVTSIPERTYAPGEHTLHVEMTDSVGLVSRAEFTWTVIDRHDLPPTRRILLVQDRDVAHDESYWEWYTVAFRDPANWDSLLAGFEHDVWDATASRSVPPLETVARYSTIIWNIGMGPHSPAIREAMKYGLEYLSSYVRAGGNVVVVGMNPLFAMASSRRSPPGYTDVCGVAFGYGGWFTFDEALCTGVAGRAAPHFLLTRLGIRQMERPEAPSVYEFAPERTVRGATPVDVSGVFDRYLHVDPDRAGGEVEWMRDFNWIPAANVTAPGRYESWVTPVYWLDSPDPALGQLVIGLVAEGARNPRRPPSETWGNAAFLGRLCSRTWIH